MKGISYSSQNKLTKIKWKKKQNTTFYKEKQQILFKYICVYAHTHMYTYMCIKEMMNMGFDTIIAQTVGSRG